jgi:tRNA pseudouridine38-40 synthase
VGVAAHGARARDALRDAAGGAPGHRAKAAEGVVLRVRNIALIVSYDGTAYRGFQTQPGGGTIQDELERAIRSLTGGDERVEGSGRTDAGVHALGQVVSFRTASPIPIAKWALALNGRLPDDIIVRSAHEMPEEFHARYSAVRKTYRYSIANGKYPDIFTARYRYHHYRPLDEDAMRDALKFLVGEHDFTAFSSAGAPRKSNVRTIYEARLEREGSDLHLYLTGSGFLYNMVRIIAGTLIEIGEGKKAPGHIPAILETKDRNMAGPKAPARGLALWRVEYPPVYEAILAVDPAGDAQ